MQWLKHPSVNERGQSLVLVALMMAGLVAFVGLALDGGQVYEMRRKMQNAADAGTFAGARALALYKTDPTNNAGDGRNVYTRIQQYAQGDSTYGNGAGTFDSVYLNGSGTEETMTPGVPPPDDARCVKVTTHKTFNTLIISFLGFDTLSVAATATACTGAVTGAVGVRPIGVYKPVFDGLVPGNTIVLAAGNQAGASGSACDAPPGTLWLGSNSGSFAWYDLDNGNNAASDTYSWVQAGYMNWVRVNGNIYSDTGWRATTQAAWDTLVTNGGLIYLPIYDYVTDRGGGNLSYHIVDFAAFQLNYVNMNGNANQKCIKMTYVKRIKLGEIDINRDCGLGELSCGVKLTN